MTVTGAVITYFYRFVAVNYTRLAKRSDHEFKSEKRHSDAMILRTPGAKEGSDKSSTDS